MPPDTISESRGPRLQLRIDFDGTPSRPTALEIELVGTRVYVDVASGLVEDAWGYLIAAGINARVEAHSPILFEAAQLSKLALLPSQVSVAPVGVVRTLLELVTSPPPPEFPVTLHVDDATAVLSWFDGSTDHVVPLHATAIAAFLTLQVPFVADPAAWDLLMESSELRPVVGRIRINAEGFCEIVAVTPQLVESAPIPALFRIDDTHFGFPEKYAHTVMRLKGFQWEGRPPRAPLAPPPPDTDSSLVDTLARELAVRGGHALVWPDTAAACATTIEAINSLDAYPALVVTTPWHVWLWQRQIETLGRTSSISHDRADIQIITYHDFTLRQDHLRPVSIVLDDLTRPQARAPRTSRALRALIRTYPDMYKVAIVDALDDDTVMSGVMNLVRPGEFEQGLPLARRYPGDHVMQFDQHRSCYLTDCTPEEVSGTAARYGSSSVEILSPTRSQLQAIHESRTSAYENPQAHLNDVLEVVSAGTNQETSPKIARAVAFAKKEMQQGRHVAILVAHRRTSALLRAALMPADVYVADGASGSRVTDLVRAKDSPFTLLVHHRSTQPDLSTFDTVLVVDYPWGMDVLDHMVGFHATPSESPDVHVLHLSGTPDDRIALFAAMRKEESVSFAASNVAPTIDEALYLLAPRHTSEVAPPAPLLPSQVLGASQFFD